MDIRVRRNAFGGQRESFEAELSAPLLGRDPLRAMFIRGPVIEQIGPGTQELARLPDGRIVAVEQGNVLGASFHPEMTGESRLHERLVERVRERSRGGAAA